MLESQVTILPSTNCLYYDIYFFLFSSIFWDFHEFILNLLSELGEKREYMKKVDQSKFNSVPSFPCLVLYTYLILIYIYYLYIFIFIFIQMCGKILLKRNIQKSMTQKRCMVINKYIQIQIVYKQYKVLSGTLISSLY